MSPAPNRIGVPRSAVCVACVGTVFAARDREGLVLKQGPAEPLESLEG